MKRNNNIFQGRLSRVKKPSLGKTNCAGTAFYLTGLIPMDRYIGYNKTKKILGKCVPINIPEDRCIVTFLDDTKKKKISHLGVLVKRSTDFFYIGREEKNGPIVEIAYEIYLSLCYDLVKYYRPLGIN